MSLVTLQKVQDLQHKLAGRSKSKPKERFYSLYDKVCRKEVLWEAWQKVKGNGGSGGVDGVTVEGIKATGEKEYLRALWTELKGKEYKPLPLRRVWILKANGKKRPLGIPTVKDRIVQQAVRSLMEPIFEAHFSEVSFGFRPGRDCHQAITRVVTYLNWGMVNVVETDIVDCFGSIPHGRLLKAVARRIADKGILRTIRQWLRCGVMEEGQFQETTTGTPQGGVISPLLANIYLDALDQLWKKRKMDSKSGYNAQMVRYADDMVILTDRSPREAERLLRETLGRLDLKPHPEKTRVVNAKAGDFNFLGFNFRQRKNPRTGRSQCLFQPSQKAQKNVREKIRLATASPELNELGVVVREKVNPILRGWVNYFRIGNSSKTFKNLRNFAKKRVLRFIRRRKKQSGPGWDRISEDFLYGKLGLFREYRVKRFSQLAMA